MSAALSASSSRAGAKKFFSIFFPPAGGSLKMEKIYVSFAEYSLFYRALL